MDKKIKDYLENPKKEYKEVYMRETKEWQEFR
jgi:hypothetical protein